MKLLKTKGWVRSALTALIGVGAAAPMYGSTIVVTYEPAGVQAANPAALCGTDTECWVGTEAFNSWNGNAPFATTFPTTDASIGGLTGGISGTYTGSLTRSNNVQYGGAGGTGYYATVTHSTYTLALTVSGGVPGVNYFGLWFSALDAETNSSSTIPALLCTPSLRRCSCNSSATARVAHFAATQTTATMVVSNSLS